MRGIRKSARMTCGSNPARKRSSATCPSPASVISAPRLVRNRPMGRRISSSSSTSSTRIPARLGVAVTGAGVGWGTATRADGTDARADGSHTRKRAPGSARFTRSSSPSASRTSWREMYRPSPVPRTPFVLANGRNRRCAISGAIPGPLSVTVTQTRPPVSSMNESTLRRRGGFTPRKASRALLSRLTITCSSRLASPTTMGSSGSSRPPMEISSMLNR